MNTHIQSVTSCPNQGYKIDTPGKQRAVFFDRDGVWNNTDGFVNSADDLDRKFYPGALDAVVRLSKCKEIKKIVVVTNQGGVGLGHMSAATNQAIQERLAQRVAEAGGRVDAIYFCPNGKGYEIPAQEVDGRKPAAGMFFQAARDFSDIDLADSFMVGDMKTDIQAGENATPKMTTVLVKTGFGAKTTDANPDRVEDNISTAVDYIINTVTGKAR